MARKIQASFFEADRVLIVGYSRKHAVFCIAVPTNPDLAKAGVPKVEKARL